MNFLARCLIALIFFAYFQTGAKADEEIDDIRTPLGVLQDPPVMFCITMQDTIELATFEGDNRPLWAKKVKEGKCGQVNLPYFYSKVAAVAYSGQYPLYIMEVKLRLENTNASLPLKHIYLKVYQYVPSKPHGMIPITWKPEYANQPKEVQDWYKNAILTPSAQKRLGWYKCCDHSDVVKTQFRVNKSNGQDEWYYQRDDGTWKRVPPDVIHWGEHTPDGLPILFMYAGVETCFWPAEDGI